MIEQLAAGDDVAAVGVAAAGLHRRRRVDRLSTPRTSPGATSRLRPSSRRGIDFAVTIENDANAAGWAEFRFGAGRDVDDMVMLTIGTGRRRRDRRRRARSSAAASAPRPSSATCASCRDGLPCGCGQHGCIEQYGSGRALQREANAIADAGGIGQALAEVRARAGRARAAPPSSRLIDSPATRARSRPCASSATGSARRAAASRRVLDPELFVFGGGVAQLGEELLEPDPRARTSRHPARLAAYHPEPEFAIAELVNDAGLIGAADLARLARTPEPGGE